MSTGAPVSLKPMRREKKGRAFSRLGRDVASLVSLEPLPLMRPNSKRSASLKKKSRFSGKNRLKRVRLTWRASTSVAEKSVLIVSAPFNDGVKR
jgi:hypothetical protein